MCSIFGYCGMVPDRAAVENGFRQTKSRGPDDSRVIDTGNGLLGFHRLSIMGLTPSEWRRSSGRTGRPSLLEFSGWTKAENPGEKSGG